ncbi:C39 family peptidase [Lachnospiraceae bacterium 54-53]
MNSIYIIIFNVLFLAAVPFTTATSFHDPAGGSAAVSYASGKTDADSASAEIPQDGRYDVMLDSVLGPLTYYNQSDVRWAGFLYGGKDPLSTYGCGPTVMAMLITSLTGNQVLPTDVAQWAAANKSWCPGQGSYHRLIMDSASAYGLKAVPLKDYTLQGLKNSLDSGYLVVALMNKGHFTQQGHFIIITRVTEEGKLRIADSNNYENTKYDWDPSIIFQELNHRSSNGGPLWMIGPPYLPQ